jgi:hypothetical protein
MKDHNSHKYKGVVRGFFHQLLYIDLFRHIVALLRYIWFAKILRRLKTYDLETKAVGKNTIMHNLKGLNDLAVVRSLALIKPMTSIETLGIDSKVLAIGPRTEGELLSLVAYGFLPKNIQGFDLISYSPWVEIGDMHQMPYKDNSWDAVLMGWVIAYSNEPEVAAKEVVRVAKNGSVVAIGVEYNPITPEQIQQKIGYVPGGEKRISSTRQILDFFGANVDHVYFNHDIIPSRKHIKGSFCVVFSIKK